MSIATHTQQVKKLLSACVDELSRAKLMEAVGIRDRVSFSKNYLDPALAGGLIEMTQPDSPKSPTQKYRLTAKGREFLHDPALDGSMG
ncbi:MAG: hypothetical protein RBT80_27715 [Candidatus Vecturithrix sp.]|jgi:predicted transcriptional regulator|nr:hypothetical protein [Candidatus Vecturithrix sp.]